MSLFGSLGKLASSGLKLAKSAGKIPGVGMIPFVGNALSAVGTAASLFQLGKDLMPSGGGGVAAMTAPAGGLPALAGGASSTMQMAMPMPGGGSSLKTVHVSSQFPQDTNGLMAWQNAGILIPFNQLHTAYRAPKGFRVVHVNGVTVALRKDVASSMHLARPTHKPPISVGELNSLKRAQRTIKKVRKIHGLIKMVADHTTSHGQVKIHHKKHKGTAK